MNPGQGNEAVRRAEFALGPGCRLHPPPAHIQINSGIREGNWRVRDPTAK